MGQKQLDHNEIKHNNFNSPIYVLCDGIRSPENTGMIFRVSEAFGVQKILFSKNSPTSDNTRVKRAARSTQQIIKYAYSEDLKEDLIQLKKNGFEIIGIEITSSSKSLKKINFTKYQKIALVVGSEKSGISAEILELLDFCTHIPMYGKNSSMNVVNALAITLYELSRQMDG